MARYRPPSIDEPAELVRGLGSDRQADVRILRNRGMTVRFANGRIHQPHLDRGTTVSLRVADARRLGIATTSDLSPSGLAAVREAALGLARAAPVDPTFPGFPAGSDREVRPVAFSASTAALSPEAATRIAARVRGRRPGGGGARGGGGG